MYWAVHAIGENFLCSKQNAPQPLAEDVLYAGKFIDDLGIVSFDF
jgi:hypothetical protein